MENTANGWKVGRKTIYVIEFAEEICKKEGMDMVKVSVILPVYNEE